MKATEKTLLALSAAGIALTFLAARGLAVPGYTKPVQVVDALVAQIVGEHFPGVDPKMVLAIARIESSLNPTAVRFEPHISDFSVGLMQTLVGTAQWLHDIGYREFGRPGFDDLLDMSVSIYFGAAFIDWLQTRSAVAGRETEVIIRAYNGGAGGWGRDATLAYWQKYQRALGA